MDFLAKSPGSGQEDGLLRMEFAAIVLSESHGSENDHSMKHYSLAILLHGAVLLPFAVTAAVLIFFRQYVAAALFSFLPAFIVVGIWWFLVRPDGGAVLPREKDREN